MLKRTVSKIKNFRIAAFGGILLFAFFFISAPEQNFKTAETVILPEVYERDDRLQEETDALLPLFDNMPPVKVFLNNEPIVKSGTNTERGVAYTDCAKNENPTIFVKKAFYLNANQKQVVNILKHELTHAFFCRQGQMWGHDEQFRRKFEAVGGFGN
jgi:hypothetical protein